VVTDLSGRRVVNATVIARNRGTNVELRRPSDSGGSYKFTLPMGSYDLTVERQGFERAVRENIAVFIGGTGELDFSLRNGRTSDDR